MSKLRFKCIKVYPNGPDHGAIAVQTYEGVNQFHVEEDREDCIRIDVENPRDFPDNWELVSGDEDNVDVINGVEFTLRENADIVWLAMEAAQSKDSTALKLYFKKKLNLK